MLEGAGLENRNGAPPRHGLESHALLQTFLRSSEAEQMAVNQKVGVSRSPGGARSGARVVVRPQKVAMTERHRCWIVTPVRRVRLPLAHPTRGTVAETV